VLVIVGQRMILVASDREFDLDMAGAGKRIVREYEGNRVVGAAVVEAAELKDS